MQHLGRTAQQVQLQGTDSIIVMYLKESFLLTVVHLIKQCCYSSRSERVKFSHGHSIYQTFYVECVKCGSVYSNVALEAV